MVASLLTVSAIGCLAIFWILNPPRPSRWQGDFVGSEQQLELMSLKYFSIPRFNRMLQEWSYALKFMNRQAEDLAQHYWQVKAVLQAHPQLRGYYAEQLGMRRVQLADQLEAWFTKGMALREPDQRIPEGGWSPQSVDATPSLLDYTASAPTAVGAGMLLLGATVAFLNRGYDLPKLQQLLTDEELGRAFLEQAALEEARHYQLQQLIFHAHPDIRFHYLQTLQRESLRLQRMVEALFPPAPKGFVTLWWDSLDPEIQRLLGDFGLLAVAATVYLLFNYLLPSGPKPKRSAKTEPAGPQVRPDFPVPSATPTSATPEAPEAKEAKGAKESAEARETPEAVFFPAPLALEAPRAPLALEATPNLPALEGPPTLRALGVSPTNPPTPDPEPGLPAIFPTQTNNQTKS